MTRTGWFIWLNEINQHNCLDVSEFNEDVVEEETRKYPQCTKYWPPSFHVKGEKAGIIKFPGKKFALDIFATVMNEEYNQWREFQMSKYKARIKSADAGGLVIPEEEKEAMEEWNKETRGDSQFNARIWYGSSKEEREEKLINNYGEKYVQERLNGNNTIESVTAKLNEFGLDDNELVPGSIVKRVWEEGKVLYDDYLSTEKKSLLVPYQLACKFTDPIERRNEYNRLDAGYTTLFPGLNGKFKKYEDHFNI